MTDTNISESIRSIENVFSEKISWELGQRLGVSYLLAQQNERNVQIGDRIIPIQQSSLGVIAITGVVWDAGLYMVDFLTWICTAHSLKSSSGSLVGHFFEENPLLLGRTLDLGCGTGVVGLAALALNASYVVFSDMNYCCEENITSTEALTEDERNRCKFVQYDWSKPIPIELTEEVLEGHHSEMVWDTVLCGDVVYENKALDSLLHCLRNLSYRRLVIGYKRRHDDQEREFFNRLSEICDVGVVSKDLVPIRNLQQSDLVGLYIIVAVKKHR